MNCLAFFQNWKAAALSVGAEHLWMIVFSLTIFPLVLWWQEKEELCLSSRHFCEAYGTISIRCFLKAEQSRLSFIFKISVYLNCLYSWYPFYLVYFQALSCLYAIAQSCLAAWSGWSCRCYCHKHQACASFSCLLLFFSGPFSFSGSCLQTIRINTEFYRCNSDWWAIMLKILIFIIF